MRKILISLTTVLSLLLAGCGNSLDIPKIEGTYESTHMSSQSDEILSTTRVIVTKIGKNKYGLKGEYEGFDQTIKVYQEVEVLKVGKDREKHATFYSFTVRELQSGEGTKKLKDYTRHPEETTPIKEFPLENMTNLKVDSFSFKPKSATTPKDEIYFSFNNVTIDGSKKFLMNSFSGNRIK